tara:strand:+ start:98 stop:304 length:207 start_codon:yes stop_codon:yes gene_type:complete
MQRIDRIIDIVRSLKEDAVGMPANNISGGNIAGSVEAGDDPPVRRKKRYIYQKGLRKTWSPTDGRKSS